MSGSFEIPRRRTPPTWTSFKSAVTKVDNRSLLVGAAATNAMIEQGQDMGPFTRQGLTPWNIADVARTAIAYGSLSTKSADFLRLRVLCNMNVQLVDQGVGRDDLDRILARIMFEQFPGQRSVSAEVARALLLFGSAAEEPPDFRPEAMTPGWFETMMDGLTFDDYVGSVFFVFVMAIRHDGRFSLDVLDQPNFREVADVLALESVRHTFTNHLVTTVDEFRRANQVFQAPLPDALKKYAFNPLADKPFISGIAPTPISPWPQAIIAKASPPSIYHLALPALGEKFSRDLGGVFEHYTGRQLSVIEGDRQVLPEVTYGRKQQRLDSCDWFLDLPDLLVLIECKARQPTEPLRLGDTDDWLDSVKTSIGKGIFQLNRSNKNIDQISAARPEVDPSKPRVGLVITLEPFYVDNSPFIRSQLLQAEFPVGILSIGELERLVLLDVDELALALRDAASAASDNVMLLHSSINHTANRRNPLLDATWDSIGLFQRLDKASTASVAATLETAPAVGRHP